MCSDLLYSRYFSPGENFRQFRHLLLLAKILSVNIFLCVNDYIVDMATFTALAKIKSGKLFMQYMSAGFGENFLPRNVSTIQYLGQGNQEISLPPDWLPPPLKIAQYYYNVIEYDNT